MTKILNIAGARPNFMKVAPLIRAMREVPSFEQKLVHTGQHYDASMSQVFFDELGIPAPFVNLEVGPGARIEQIERIMERFEPVVRDERPDAVLVVGDVNSTVACARVAKRHGVPVVHVEAGLRSFDESMPEELNRVETDRLSDLLFVTEQSGMDNLARERIAGKAFHVGNVMIDTLVEELPRARAMRLHETWGLQPNGYAVGTFHRPSNVDAVDRLRDLIELIRFIAARLPLVLPLHPRTQAALERFCLLESLRSISSVVLTEPLGYVEFLSLLSEARAVVTDSGGVQEETTFLRVPCVTMRDNTERPITVSSGSNILAGSSAAATCAAIEKVLSGPARCGEPPSLWDGATARRIVNVLKQELN